MPPTGNQPVFAATNSSTRPDSTSGTDSQTHATSERPRSTQLCCRTADHTPSGIASPNVTSAAEQASSSVFSSPSRSTVNTGWCRENDSPKSKWRKMFCR